MTVLLILLVVLPWSIRRQMRVHPLTPAGMMRLPLVFAAIGVLGFGLGDIPDDRGVVTYLALSATVSIALGIWRGALMPIWTDAEGQILTRANRATLALWIALIVTKVAMGTAASLTGLFPGQHPGEIFLAIAVSFVAQNVVLAQRVAARGVAPAA